MRRMLVLAALSVLAACGTPPKRVESVGLPPVAPDVSLVVVPGENMRQSIEFNRLHSRSTNLFDPLSKLPKDQPINNMVSTLIYDFKSVLKVDSVNQAKTMDADLIGVIDYYFHYGITTHLFTKHVYRGDMSIDEALLLLDRAGNQVAKIEAHATRDAEELNHASPAAVFKEFGSDPYLRMFRALQDEILEKFQTALGRSEDLQRWRERRPASAPASVAAAPVAAAALHSDVDAPKYKKEEDPSRFAVVVGVEEYQNLPAAAFAERDARAVRDHLLALGYPDRNVVLLTGREAGKSGLEKYLESWLPRNTDENSQVLVYFAGHGAPDAKSGEAFLMPWDGDAKFVETTAYPVKRLYMDLGALKAKRVVVALDSCFSGAGGRSVMAKGARPLVARVDAGVPGSDRVVVLAAASGDEIAGTVKGQGHGLFTYYLLKGLNEQGGSSPLKTLYQFLKPKVQDAARRDDRDQTPRLLPAAGGSETL